MFGKPWKAAAKSLWLTDRKLILPSMRLCACWGWSKCSAFTSARNCFELIDLRREQWTNRDGVITVAGCRGDPYGNIAFDLGNASEFAGHRGAGRYYGADYDSNKVNQHHLDGRHEYLLAGSAIGCDVLINLPKLKTHKKAGVTLSLKNLVGINTDKNWLPHHTEGDPARGGR